MAYDQFDVYVSYAPEDAERVRAFVHELEWMGLKVWFSNQPATSQESLQMLRGSMNSTTCQIVVWTNNSAGSGRIQAEARAGSGLGRLIAVRLDSGIIPPPGTEARTYADLGDWTGGNDHRGMKKVLAGIWMLIGKGQQPEPADVQVDTNERTNVEFGTKAEVAEEAITPEQKDEKAWKTAETYNSRTYFEHYLQYFPNGRHAEEARERIAKKKRTSAIVITCAVVYMVLQLVAALVLSSNRF